MIPSSRTRLLVVGKPDMGKSSHVKRLMRDWQTRGLSVIALDVCDEYSRGGNPSRLVELGTLRDRLTPQDVAKNPKLLLKPRLSLAVVSGEHPRAAARAFQLLSRLLVVAGKPCVLVLDEVGLWTAAGRHPECHKAAAELCALAVGGRKYGIAMVLVSQRSSQVPQEVRSTVTDVHAYLQDTDADLEALELRCGKPFAEQTSQLGKYSHVAWSDAATTTTRRPTLKSVP